ncbi:2-(3-amino-3-carboxypropyl)histidine synthase subunit 2 [Latimeria chalumnae]|uniref:2-(3-amino-3-carboxypropyl)histidine synthase subunit 2 n=1 Tax=Latimeria chalumnae TaxID=7897 RepID=UPI0003C11434
MLFAGSSEGGATLVTMATVFSSDGEQTVQRELVTIETLSKTRLENLDEVYQIERTIGFIRAGQLEKVALQFPDELLIDSAAIAMVLEKITQAKIFILGDTSYGSCCVDEVAAEHVGADGIIHYGRACLSPTRRLPVLYVFGQNPVDTQRCADCFRELYPDPQSQVIVLYDVVYSYIQDSLQHILSLEYENIVFSKIIPNGTLILDERQKAVEGGKGDCGRARVIEKFGRLFTLGEGRDLDEYGMFYIGKEGPTLTNFMMTWNKCSFSSFDPATGHARRETLAVSRALMKRYYLIERARDAQVVGIVAGTLGVADYLTIIERLKEAIRRAGKKSYTFVMGKLNVPKMANFLEVDVYVLVACPENSLLDCSEFYRPVVTPYEMEIACNRAREWTGEYITDFRDLLPGACNHVPFPENKLEEEETDLSLITGNLRSTHLERFEPQTVSSCTSLTLKNQNLMLAESNSAASFLASRSWQGLEQKLGETPVTKAVEGRRGIAIAYEDEITSDENSCW